jgi:predicted nucleotidyltransferase
MRNKRVELNDDFEDFISSLNYFNVEYLIVGGYAVIHYGHSRTTGDIDIWVRDSSENYQKIKSAFMKFGMPVFDMTEENFQGNAQMDVFSFGKPPVSIDILTKVKGLVFDEAFNNANDAIWDNIPVKVIDLRDLVRAKKAAGRHKDLDDIQHLED